MEQETRSRAVNRVYGISLAANLVMLTLKLTVGFLTGSLVMLADGVDSSLDAIANIIAMLVTRVAGNPPDADHPYGHRRYETLAAMLVGGFLLITASEIVKSGVSRLISGTVPDLTLANFAVMALAFAVNFALFFLQRGAGRRLKSEVLIASSEDKRSDIMVSITVLVSLVTVQLGYGWIDAAAALVVVALISRNALNIIKHAADVLVDRAALDAQTVSQIVEEIPSVKYVSQVRSRGSEDDVHVDLVVSVPAPTPIEQTAAITDEIINRLRTHFEGLSEIEVTFQPAYDLPPDFTQIARTEAAALGISAHEISAVRIGDGLILDVHVEVNANQKLETAHEIVSRFEDRLRQAIPTLTEIVTHIEPYYDPEDCVALEGEEELAQQVMHIVTNLYPDNYWHNLNLRASPGCGGYTLSIHCQTEGSVTVAEAHELAEAVETRLRSDLPEIHRITIHTEPWERVPSAA